MALPVNAVERMGTQILHPDFHTLQLKVNGNDQLLPVIALDSDDRLEISFDELSSDRRYMRYELIHCNALWQPDGLLPNEYTDPFNETTIDDYAFSQATAAQYVNYRLTLPNAEMPLLVSGNYLVRVYDEQSPDETLLQAAFSVVEPAMKVTGGITTRTDVDTNVGHQQLTIGIDPNGTAIHNPYADVIVAISQNGRADNAIAITGPTRMAGEVMWWEHDRRLIFPAGNEYRRMEIISTTYPGMGVDELGFAHPFYHATLYVDEPRADQPYIYDSTQHGRFRVREYNASDPDVQADYIITHFALDHPEMSGADIFIDGDMVQRRFSPESRMVFNRASHRYENAMMLKQGAYNYQYLVVPHGSLTGSAAPIEGDKYQTVNEYLVKVYLRTPGQRYDRLVGATVLTSGI